LLWETVQVRHYLLLKGNFLLGKKDHYLILGLGIGLITSFLQDWNQGNFIIGKILPLREVTSDLIGPLNNLTNLVRFIG